MKAVLAEVAGEDGAAILYDRFRAARPDHQPGRLLSDILSFEFFHLPSLAIAANLADQGISVRLFEFAYDLPGLGGSLQATHTGDMAFIFRNDSIAELAAWPGFSGLSDDELRRQQVAVRELGGRFAILYGGFLRGTVTGAEWPLFDGRDRTSLVLGSDVEFVSGLRREASAAYAEVGLNDVATLEGILVGNVRRDLIAEGGGHPSMARDAEEEEA